MVQKSSVESGAYVFYIRNRKILTAGAIFLILFGLPVKIYNAPVFDQNHKYEDIGFLFDTAFICLVLPIWMLMKVRKATKAYKNQEEWEKL
jgi:hypothetical protein